MYAMQWYKVMYISMQMENLTPEQVSQKWEKYKRRYKKKQNKNEDNTLKMRSLSLIQLFLKENNIFLCFFAFSKFKKGIKNTTEHDNDWLGEGTVFTTQQKSKF